MKGVVKPHAIPTMMNPSVQLRMEGGGSGVAGSVPGSIIARVLCQIVWYEAVVGPGSLIQLYRNDCTA